MIELIAASKLGALISSSVKSITAITSKEITSKAIKTAIESASTKHASSLFSERGALSDSLLPLDLNEGEEKQLVELLNSDLFSSIVRSAPAIVISESDRPSVASVLTQQLINVFPSKPEPFLRTFSEELSNLLLETSTRAWEEAQTLGLTAPGPAIASSTHSMVAAEVSSIANQVREGARFSAQQLREFELFEVRYRKAVGSQHAKLKPETLGDAKEVPIDALYVPSNLSPIVSSKSRQLIDRATLLASSFRTVILGNPGGGKSTFAKKLCQELNADYEGGVFGGRALTPVMVVLREYAKYTKQNPCSILDFVNLRCKADLQIEPLNDAIRYMFMTGRALVIFDGLDELMDTTDRIETKQKVERFVDQYQAVSILVTSREVGYEQAPLDSGKFDVYRLEPFTDEEVSSYAHKWFSINHDAVLDKEGMRAKAFVRDSSLVVDLRKNPLILSLLCSLYKQDGYLPSNRPEVYRRCADLLFEKWDKSRGIVVSLPIEKKLRPAMGHLAHWIYADKTLQAGVSEKLLIRETANYLSRWCADIDEAQDTAQKFVSFFRGRAWVFSDTGSGKSEPLYGFTHNTFLEFFTAEYLVKNYGTARQLRDYLLPRLLSREWDVVCQLAYQMYSEFRNAADELAIELLESAETLPFLEQMRLASFLARSLDFIFPSRIIRTSAVSFCLKMILGSLSDQVGDQERYENIKGLAAETLSALMSCGNDMLPLHASLTYDIFREFANNPANGDRRIAVLLLVDLMDDFASQGGPTPAEAQASVWITTQNSLIEDTLAARLSLIEKSNLLAKSSWWARKVDLKTLDKLHGVKAFFAGFANPLLAWYRVGIAEYLLNVAVRSPRDDVDADLRALAEGSQLRDLFVNAGKHPDDYPEFEEGLGIWSWGRGKLRWPEDPKHRDLAVLMLTSPRCSPLVRGGQFVVDISLVRAAKVDETKRSEAMDMLVARGFGEDVIQLMSEWIYRDSKTEISPHSSVKIEPPPPRV